jgi:cellulose biosynthesis protein BcsQ
MEIFEREMLTDLMLDYLVIDTSPGIRNWSINALAISDILLHTLKSGDIDSKGTKCLVEDIYVTFTAIKIVAIPWQRPDWACFGIHTYVMMIDNSLM